MTEAWHLYEVVISNFRVWLKIQSSCLSSEQSAVFFEYRFNGTDYTPVDGHRPVTPFRLSQRSHYLANWVSIADRLPAGWDDDEFHIVENPYPWCETLSDDCDCHGAKGRLDAAYCSDFGLHDEADKRASKSDNVRHRQYIQSMEERIAGLDVSRRKERLERERRSPPRGEVLFEAKPGRARRRAEGYNWSAGCCDRSSQPIGCPGVVLLDPRKASPIRRAGHTENDGAPYCGLRTNVDFE